jgi:hypothetical protein
MCDLHPECGYFILHPEMLSSAHSHSGEFCRHAKDTLEGLVRRAIEVRGQWLTHLHTEK